MVVMWSSAVVQWFHSGPHQQQNPAKEVEFMMGEDEGGADETKPANEEVT